MDKTQQTFDFITKYIEKYKFPPSIREIATNLEFDSTSSAVYHLKKLEQMGKIIRNANKNRAIEINSTQNNVVVLPIVGKISSGQPILAEEDLIDNITISENLFLGNDLFVLQVQGTSMINAGILNGDFVVISKQNVAKNGEIVACLIDNEATIKRFYKENNRFRLQPENFSMNPIYVNEVTILGKVIGLIRNNI